MSICQAGGVLPFGLVHQQGCLRVLPRLTQRNWSERGTGARRSLRTFVGGDNFEEVYCCRKKCVPCGISPENVVIAQWFGFRWSKVFGVDA